MNVGEVIQSIIREEGGWVDNPNDRGKATKHGVSLRYAIGIGLDLDGDGDTDADDIMLVDKAKAAELYRDDFLLKPRIYRLPEPIVPFVLDWAINSGPPRAIMAVQETCHANGYLPGQIDGVIGPKTIKAATALVGGHGAPSIIKLLVMRRLDFIADIVKNDPSQRGFLKGWIRRSIRFLD